MFHNVHNVFWCIVCFIMFINEIIMCSCHADDQAGFPPSVIREHTCILRNCMGACVRVCVCVYTFTYLYVSLVW